MGGSGNPDYLVASLCRCQNLLNADLLSLSDPFCVVSMRQNSNLDWVEIFRTETIQVEKRGGGIRIRFANSVSGSTDIVPEVGF